MRNVKNILAVALVVSMVLLSGCSAWHKAGPGSSLLSLKILDSGETGTETFAGTAKTAESCKDNFDNKMCSMQRQEHKKQIAFKAMDNGVAQTVDDLNALLGGN